MKYYDAIKKNEVDLITGMETFPRHSIYWGKSNSQGNTYSIIPVVFINTDFYVYSFIHSSPPFIDSTNFTELWLWVNRVLLEALGIAKQDKVPSSWSLQFGELRPTKQVNKQT